MRYAYQRTIGKWRTLEAWWYATVAPTTGSILTEASDPIIAENGFYLVIE